MCKGLGVDDLKGISHGELWEEISCVMSSLCCVCVSWVDSWCTLHLHTTSNDVHRELQVVLQHDMNCVAHLSMDGGTCSSSNTG